MKFVILATLLALATAEGRSLLATNDDSGKPESPPYEVVNSTDSLEIRKYEAGKQLSPPNQ